VSIRIRGVIGSFVAIGASVVVFAGLTDDYPGAPVDRTALTSLWAAGNGQKGPCVMPAGNARCEFCYTCVGNGSGCAVNEAGKACTMGSDGGLGAQDNCDTGNSCICGAVNPYCNQSNNNACTVGSTTCIAVTQGCESRGTQCTCSKMINVASGTASTCTSP